jgi:hypothetical protein
MSSGEALAEVTHNAYAGQYHHDTNPAADQVDIVDGELRLFVERAIQVVHSGMV